MFLLGLASALVSGLSYPVWSILLADLVAVLGLYKDDPEKLFNEIKHYSVIFVIYAIVAGIVEFSESFSFCYIGERITTDLRYMTFK